MAGVDAADSVRLPVGRAIKGSQMGFIGEMLATGGRRAHGFARRAMTGIPAELFARKPVVGGATVDSNHPAFVYGHLALYPARIVALVGLESPALSTPPAWTDLFSAGRPCLDDPRGSIYPPMAVITEAFVRGYDAALAAVGDVDDSVLMRELPDEARRKDFPTIGGAVLVYLNNHVALHMGQVSAWRRCMGVGPVP